MTLHASAWILASLFAITTLPAQQPGYAPLPKPDKEFAEPFTSINGVRELRDGRVVVSDPRDKVVQLVDFASGTLRKIGREGSGPREYALPLALVALPADSSAIYDPLNSRLLSILPNGEPGDFFTLPSTQTARGPGGGTMVSMTPPRYTDDKGRFYVTGSGFTMGPDGPVAAESLAVLRIDRATRKADTVAFLRIPKDNATVSGSAGRIQMRMGGGNPFAPRDEWAVTPDGRVAVIRAPEYRVDWVAPARATGAPIPYERIKVAEGHKQQWRDSQRNRTMIAITNNNGRTSVSSGPGATPPVEDPGNWPEYLPPFLGQGSVTVAPNGDIWIARTRDAKDLSSKYDVIDGSGKVARRFSLPPKTRVIGFGKGVVYTIRTDDDDLQYLQRIRLP